MARRDAILGVLFALAIAPFWSGALVASVDLPQHLAIAVLAERGSSPAYSVDLWPRPYVGLTYLLLGLYSVMEPLVAGRVLLSLLAFGLVWAVRAVVDAARRDPRSAWLGPLFVGAWPIAYGLLPYVAGLVPTLLAIALARRDLEAPRPIRRWSIPIAIAVALLFHPLPALLGALGLLPIFWRHPQRARYALGIAIAIGALLLLAGLGPTRPSGLTTDEAITTWWRLGIKHKITDYVLGHYEGRIDQLLAWPAFFLIALSTFLGRRAPSDPIERSALLVFVAYLLAPSDLALGGLRISLLAPRILLMAWLLAIAVPRGPLRAWAAYAGALSTAAFSIYAAVEAHRFGEAWGPPTFAAMVAIPRGAVIDPQVSAAKSSIFDSKLIATPEQSLHAYSIVAGAAEDRLVFSTPQSPVRLLVAGPPTLTWVQSATATISLRAIPAPPATP